MNTDKATSSTTHEPEDDGTEWARRPTPTEDAFDGDTERGADTQELALFYLHLADAEFDGYCDLYAHLARSIASDPEMLAQIAAMAPAAKIIPILLFAAIHDHLLAHPQEPLAAIYRGDPGDGWPPFRAFLLDHFDELRAVVHARTIQTNEVGRSAVLLPTLTAIHRVYRRPLAMIELGPSAGLNLYLDRFSYDYTSQDPPYASERTAGDLTSSVRLSCQRRGPLHPPLDADPPPIASRMGIDINPIDVTDEDASRWLEACLWPLVPDRAERLRAALHLARSDPPDLRNGTIMDHLPAMIDAVPADVVPVIISTWVLAYFSKDGRLEVSELLHRLGERRELACVTAEYPSVVPWISRPTREAHDNSGQAATVVGLAMWQAGVPAARPIAWTHAHGRWIDWLDDETADGPSLG